MRSSESAARVVQGAIEELIRVTGVVFPEGLPANLAYPLDQLIQGVTSMVEEQSGGAQLDSQLVTQLCSRLTELRYLLKGVLSVAK